MNAGPNTAEAETPVNGRRVISCDIDENDSRDHDHSPILSGRSEHAETRRQHSPFLDSGYHRDCEHDRSCCRAALQLPCGRRGRAGLHRHALPAELALAGPRPCPAAAPRGRAGRDGRQPPGRRRHPLRRPRPVQWESDNSRGTQKPGDLKAGIEHGCFNILKTGQIRTKRHFGDCQLHVEWCTPAKPDGNNLTWGNSGVFFLGKYELQIIESHDSGIYADGQAGAIYGQTPPLVNAARKPGQWQTFDVVFTAPRFDGREAALEPAYFTVFWNGVLVQDHTAALGPTRHKELATYDSRETTGPIMLQYHHSAVRFRNIWVRPLKPVQ